jgi:hypothetical protein
VISVVCNGCACLQITFKSENASTIAIIKVSDFTCSVTEYVWWCTIFGSYTLLPR